MTRRFSGEQLLLATHNRGKLAEIAALLHPMGIATLSAADLGLPEPAETENTFAGNARIKAHAAAQAAKLPALADDSGITIDALGGAPGVYTADWATTPTGRDFDLAMRRAWLALIESRAPEPWGAQFRCTLVLAWPDGHDEVFEGVLHGRFVWPMRGATGHGYDPVFQPEGFPVTFAEMNLELKNRISHRAIAFRALIAECFT